MWTSTTNKTDLIHPFPTILDKDIPSKGDFNADYSAVSGQYGVVACPFVAIAPTNDATVRVTDAAIDLSSWRAMLLAMCASGRTMRQVVVHNCELSPQHLRDLALALNKAGTVKTVKIQHSLLNISENTETEYIDAFKELLNDTTQIEYLSLKGSGLTDAVVCGFALTLTTNFKLMSVNLASNNIGNSSLEAIANAVRLVGSYKSLSFASNQVEASGVESMLSIVLGTPWGPKDDAEVKAFTKALADKNKAVKELNKKRKKAGQTEISEYSPLLECKKSIDGKTFASNSNLVAIDFSRINFTASDWGHLLEFVSNYSGVNLAELSSQFIFSKNDQLTAEYEEGFSRFCNFLTLI